MMTVAQLAVEVVANTKPATEGLNQTNKEVEKSGGLFSKFSEMAKGAVSSLLGFVGGQVIMQGVNFVLGQVTQTISAMFDEAGALTTAETQLNAVLASTHDVSGMTRQAIMDLSDQLSQMSGVAQSTILSGENMLLTFTGIGKDVFPMASQSLLDFAIAMNGGSTSNLDLKNSAIQLGKALNDPLTGLHALQREGVTFSAQEVELIKHFMAVGDVADAQKVMLKELQTEFGGSAQAAGSTFGGALDKLKNIIVDFGANAIQKLETWLQPFIKAFADNLPSALEAVGKALAPVGDAFGLLWKIWSTQTLPELQALWQLISTDVQPGLQALWGVVQQLAAPFQQLGTVLAQAAAPMLAMAQHGSTMFGFFQPLNDLVYQATQGFNTLASVLSKGIGNSFTQTLKDWGPIVQSLAGWFRSSMLPALQSILPPVEHLAGILITKGVPAFFAIRDAASHLIATIVSTLLPVFEKVEPIVARLVGWLIDMGGKALGFLIPQVQSVAAEVSKFATEMGTRLAPFIQNVVQGIQVGATIIQSVWGTLWPWISSILKTAWDSITFVLKLAWSVISGIFKVGADLLSGNWKQAWADIQDTFTNVWNTIKGFIGTIWDDIKGIIAAGINAAIDLLNHMIDAADLIPGVKIDHISHVNFAGGGVMPYPGYAVVGEHGWEPVFLPQGARTVSHNEAIQALKEGGGGGRGGHTFNINGTNINYPQQMAAVLKREMALHPV